MTVNVKLRLWVRLVEPATVPVTVNVQVPAGVPGLPPPALLPPPPQKIIAASIRKIATRAGATRRRVVARGRNNRIDEATRSMKATSVSGTRIGGARRKGQRLAVDRNDEQLAEGRG